MLSVEEAKKLVADNTVPIARKKNIRVSDALNYYTADDIYSPLDLPPFNQSNVDGFAICFPANEGGHYTILAEVKAGDVYEETLRKGEAVRVFTGAMVPAGADAIVMQEYSKVEGDKLVVSRDDVKQGEYIRPKGSQIINGALAMHKKTLLTPGAIGFLYAMGLEVVSIIDKPVISLVVTGNELQQAGEILTRGKVYDSNSPTLMAAVEKDNFKIKNSKLVIDEKGLLKNALQSFLQGADVLLVSGGISVGKYDLVEEALEELGVQKIFHNVAQRPGKPLYFGKYKDTLVFGLPGNPSSALTCYYEYVLPALNKMIGREPASLSVSFCKLSNEFSTASHLSYFVRGKITVEEVLVLEGFESYKMKAYAEADCLIYLPKGKEKWLKGEMVEVHLIR